MNNVHSSREPSCVGVTATCAGTLLLVGLVAMVAFGILALTHPSSHISHGGGVALLCAGLIPFVLITCAACISQMR